MTRILLPIIAVSGSTLAQCQSLYNNAVMAGLSQEGLRTRPRPGGGDYSEVQLGNAATAASFRQWTFRLADDFSVPAPGWKINSITVFGYQPTIHFPSLDQGVLEIRTMSPVGPIVATGILVSSEMTDIYRIFNNRPDDDRQVQKVRYRVSATLPAGKYWFTFSAFGIDNFDGPWGPFLTKAGALTVPGANAMGRVTGPYIGWEPLIDPGSHLPQDLPFYIDGHRLGLIGPKP